MANSLALCTSLGHGQEDPRSMEVDSWLGLKKVMVNSRKGDSPELSWKVAEEGKRQGKGQL